MVRGGLGRCVSRDSMEANNVKWIFCGNIFNATCITFLAFHSTQNACKNVDYNF